MNTTMATRFFPAPDEQHFCSQCGSSLKHEVPADDTRVRAMCFNCGAIHYRNPRMVVGTITQQDNKILLCKRAIEPRLGFWTLPAGFMELHETTEQGAIRETYEESGVHVKTQRLFSIVQIPQVSQVHLYYLANVINIEPNFGAETSELAWVDSQDIPWNELAFESVTQTLKALIKHPSNSNHVYEINLAPR